MTKPLPINLLRDLGAGGSGGDLSSTNSAPLIRLSLHYALMGSKLSCFFRRRASFWINQSTYTTHSFAARSHQVLSVTHLRGSGDRFLLPHVSAVGIVYQFEDHVSSVSCNIYLDLKVYKYKDLPTQRSDTYMKRYMHTSITGMSACMHVTNVCM